MRYLLCYYTILRIIYESNYLGQKSFTFFLFLFFVNSNRFGCSTVNFINQYSDFVENVFFINDAYFPSNNLIYFIVNSANNLLICYHVDF